jgi:hypothetical protein
LFTIDMDPRWVKTCIGEGRADEAGRYAGHLIGQVQFLLETQNVDVLVTTPPLLELIARNDRLVELINEKVRFILWSGAHLDPDTRHLSVRRSSRSSRCRASTAARWCWAARWSAWG